MKGIFAFNWFDFDGSTDWRVGNFVFDSFTDEIQSWTTLNWHKDQGSGYYSKGNTKYVDLFDFVKARFHEG